MRCYLVTTGSTKVYAGTQALARDARDELMKKDGLKKKDVTIQEADIPLAKAELLKFINELISHG